MLGAYGRDKLNENGKLLLGFAKDNKLALLNTLFCTPKSGVFYTFQSANRSREQAPLDYNLTKQADRRLIRCVDVRRPPLEAPDGVSVELFKITLNGDPALRRRLLDIVVRIWRGVRCRSSGNMPSS